MQYAKSAVLLPRYVKNIHDAVGRMAAPITIAEEEKRKGINHDMNAVGAILKGDMVSLKGINIRLQPPRVIETIHEVLLRDDYYFFQMSGPYVTIDVGMNVGLASLCKAKDPGCVMSYAYEPLLPTYQLALQNIELNPDLKPKIKAFNFGLSDRDEELVIKYTPDHIMSVSSESTFDACFDANVTNQSIQIKQASKILDPVLLKHKREGKEKIFLKIDCEGAEYKIMNDLDAHGLLRDIDVAIIEWHNKKPDEILEILAKNGFFCFTSLINVEWNVGLIKAVRTALC